MLAAIVSALIGGAAGEAGKGAWTSLTTLVRRRFGGDSAELAELEQAGPDDSHEIAGLLVDRGESDPRFREELTSWVSETARTIRQSHDVSNTISGEARIHGNVIQAGDVFGSINLGPR
ncbi:hypothetical protein [Streptosporangium sp. NPDC051022]|uniref:hypothetical protein n=1 Tax=Streptosporangium sp. NPDC051022 TaxID=3155752 RepID=UPI0034320B6F